jgi:hypothetical protein
MTRLISGWHVEPSAAQLNKLKWYQTLYKVFVIVTSSKEPRASYIFAVDSITHNSAEQFCYNIIKKTYEVGCKIRVSSKVWEIKDGKALSHSIIIQYPEKKS